MTDISEFERLETLKRVSNTGSISVFRWKREGRTYFAGTFTNNYYPSPHRVRDQPETSVTYLNVPLSETFKAEHFVRTPQTVPILRQLCFYMQTQRPGYARLRFYVTFFRLSRKIPEMYLKLGKTAYSTTLSSSPTN